jgi:magnesium-dependent phosphatase 1
MKSGAASPCRMQTLRDFIDHAAMYPRNKRHHFKQLLEDSGIAYEDMLFFDNDQSNIRHVEELGVTCIHCPDGLNHDVWRYGLTRFQHKTTANQEI